MCAAKVRGLTLTLVFFASACSAAHAIFPAADAMTRRANATNDLPSEGEWHSVEVTPSARLPRIHLPDKLNPLWWFKNADDPKPPDWFKPGQKHRSLRWFLRNPFHNFTFYVIGIADKKHLRSGRYPKTIGKPDGGWNFAVSRYKCLRLPFVYYSRHGIDFYLGWRTRGNFGGKFNINPKRPFKRAQSEPHLTAPSDKTALPLPEP
jgi:hypothetical protein